MKINNPVQRLVAGAFLSAAMLFASAPAADAMPLKTFDHMSDNDQGRYVSVLFGQTVRHLWLNGEEEQGNTVLKMFKRSSPTEVSSGMDELVDIISGLRQMEKKDPTKVPHVEHAMAILLKRHGIAGVTTKDLMQFAKDFQPQDEGIAKKNNKTPSGPAASIGGADDMKLAKN